MVREAKIVELTNSTGFPRRYTVAAGVNITKKSLMKLTDPRTAVLTDAADADALIPNAGIAVMEKDSTDNSTSISVYTNCIAELHASGAITLGAPITFITGNYAMQASALASGACVAGYALETVSDGEVFNARIDL